MAGSAEEKKDLLNKPASEMTLYEMLQIVRKAKEIAGKLNESYVDPIVDNELLEGLAYCDVCLKHKDLLFIAEFVLVRLEEFINKEIVFGDYDYEEVFGEEEEKEEAEDELEEEEIEKMIDEIFGEEEEEEEEKKVTVQ